MRINSSMSIDFSNPENFWLNDIIGFNFIQTNTVGEKLTSIVKVIALISFAGLLITGDSICLIGFIIALAVIYWVYTKTSKPSVEKYEDAVNIDPGNPVKNILRQNTVDIENDKTPIQNLLRDKALQDKIKESLDHNLYRDEGDIFDNYHSQRSFYTMPVTTIPNKQTEFAEWLYKMPKTCKDGNAKRCSTLNYIPARIIGTGATSQEVIIKKKAEPI